MHQLAKCGHNPERAKTAFIMKEDNAPSVLSLAVLQGPVPRGMGFGNAVEVEFKIDAKTPSKINTHVYLKS